MESLLEFLKADEFLIFVLVGMIILFVILLIVCYKLFSINRKYVNFIKKIGNGENIQEDLETFMHVVNRVEKQNLEILSHINSIEGKIKNHIQKVGLVRYSAFKDTGSDLSFALALLDDNKNGVVLNGIYSREMSNIYSKPVVNGKSTYKLSQEEEEAINKANSVKLI